MANNQVDIVIRAVDQATRELDAVQRELKALEGDAKGAAGGFDVLRRSYDRALGPSRAVATAVATAGTAALGAAGYMIKLAGDMEQTEIAFTTLLGSTEAAEDYLRRLSDFAGRTPFDLPGLQNTTRRLVAFGFEADATIPIVRVLGDAVSAMGGSDEELLGVVNAIGQIQAKGKVSAEELLQLTERGIPAYEILREKLGLTSDEVANIGTMGISSTEAIMALLEGLDDRFAGAMEAQAQTLNGILSNIRDEATRTAVEVGQSIIDALNLKDALRVALDQLSAFRERVEEVGITGVLKAMEDQIWAVAGALTGAMIPAMINMAITVSRAALRLAPWIAAGILAFKVVQDLEIGLDDVLPYIKRFALGFQGAADIVMAITGAVASFISNSIRSIVRLGNFYAQSFEVMGRARDEFLAGNWRAGYEILQSNQANADAMVNDFVDTWSAATEQLEASDALLFEGFEKIERAVAGSAASVDDALGTTGTRIEDVAASVAETGGSIEDLLALLGGEAGLTGGLQTVATEGDAAAAALDRAAAAAGRLAGTNIPTLGTGAFDPGGLNEFDIMRWAPRGATDGSVSITELRVNRMNLDERATQDAILAWAGDTVTDLSVSASDLRASAAALDQAARDAAIFGQLDTSWQPGRGSQYGEAGFNAPDVALMRQDAVLAQIERAGGAATDLSVSADEMAETIADMDRAARDSAIFGAAFGNTIPADWWGGQYGESGTSGAMTAEERRRRQDEAIFGAAWGGTTPGDWWGGQYGESGRQTTGPSLVEQVLEEAASAAKLFGTNVLTSAREAVPALDAAIAGFTQGPMVGIAGILSSVITESEAFQGIMHALNELMKPLVEAMTTMLDALAPLIEVVLSLVEVALKPLVWILETVVAPVFNAVARTIAAIWNAVVSVLNIFPWVDIGLIDLGQSQTRRVPPEDEADPDAGGGSASGSAGRPYGRVNFGGTPQAVQLAVATPLVEAAATMLQAAQMQLDQVAASPLATPVKAFGGHVDRFGDFVTRLVDEGIAISLDSGSGTRGGSRTAHLRGL